MFRQKQSILTKIIIFPGHDKHTAYHSSVTYDGECRKRPSGHMWARKIQISPRIKASLPADMISRHGKIYTRTEKFRIRVRMRSLIWDFTVRIGEGNKFFFFFSFVCFYWGFYGPVNPVGSCRARSVYLTTLLLPAWSTKRLTRNWQLLFLNQRKGENVRRKYFMINLHERMLPTRRVEPASFWSPVGRACKWATESGSFCPFANGKQSQFWQSCHH